VNSVIPSQEWPKEHTERVVPLVHTEGNCNRLINAMFNFNKSILFESKKALVYVRKCLWTSTVRSKNVCVSSTEMLNAWPPNQNRTKIWKAFVRKVSHVDFCLMLSTHLRKLLLHFFTEDCMDNFVETLARIRNEILDGSYANGNNFKAGERISITYPLLDL